ncbi:MAG: hypothetical protein AAFR44_10525, partial [Pseudomonadota bacterium]
DDGAPHRPTLRRSHMHSLARTLPALALVLTIAACTEAGPGAADEQLRGLVDGDLRRAGISEQCIQSLDTTALTQIRALTVTGPRTSREVLQRRQQLRTFVGQRYCPNL